MLLSLVSNFVNLSWTFRAKYEAQSLNTWNYHVQFSVVSVDHKQQLRADRSERCT